MIETNENSAALRSDTTEVAPSAGAVKKNQAQGWLAPLLIAASTTAVAVIGGLATRPEIPTWYATLNKPEIAPPNWIFGPVWSALYVAMAVAMWLVWRRSAGAARRTAAALYGVQLLLNLLWSVVFFHFHGIGSALIVIGALWIAIAATMRVFFPLERIAGWLLVPYLLWVSFAAYLNLNYWIVNP
jgi:benzodiazapine receptor